MKHGLETVREVQALRVGIKYVGGLPSFLVPQFREKAMKMLVGQVQPHAFDISLHDIYVRSQYFETQDYHYLDASWRPQTTVAEFVGGPLDGQLREVQSILEPLRVTSTPVGLVESPFVENMMIPVSHILYSMNGWDDEAHHWVFRPMR